MTQPKSFTLDGRRHRLPAAVPAAEIRWLVSRMHVANRDVAVAREILRRARSWPRGARHAAARYAIACHRRNGDLCRKYRL